VAAPRRKVAARPRRKELLVLVEGHVTEEGYLLFWRRRARRHTLVEIHEFHGTPLSLVEKAVEVKAEEERQEKRGRGRAHDEFWCVFDIDEHPHLERASELAAASDINLAISNPCIELWFLLHFADQTAYIDRRDAQRQARAHLKCGKDLDDRALGSLAENFALARERAQRLDEKHRDDGTPTPGNPSSGAWRVIDSITKPPG
jgi:RloB-like protein